MTLRQAETAGDGAALRGEPILKLVGTEPAEVLLFDLNRAPFVVH
jgi:hypothetical protein